MGWWWSKEKPVEGSEPDVVPEPAVEHEPRPTPARRRGAIPMEIRPLSVQASESGLTAKYVASLAGVSQATNHTWTRVYHEHGLAGLAKRSRSASTRRICTALEERIKDPRREHPEHSVRRVRDALRRDEGLSVSA